MKCFVGNNCMVDDQSMLVLLNSRSRLLSGIVGVGCLHDHGEGMSKARRAVAKGQGSLISAGKFRFHAAIRNFVSSFTPVRFFFNFHASNK